MIDAKNKKAMLNRLSRIEGQLRGIQRLINAEDPDCEKIVQQMAASRKALDKSAHVMLGCMIEMSLEQEERADIDELGMLISKYA